MGREYTIWYAMPQIVVDHHYTFYPQYSGKGLLTRLGNLRYP